MKTAGMAAAVVVVGVMVSGVVVAGDGNQLLTACQKTVQFIDGERESGTDVGYCFGLVNGVGNILSYMEADLPRNERACFPEGIKNEQLTRIVVRYLQANPASLHRDGAFLTMAAFQNAYPCKK